MFCGCIRSCWLKCFMVPANICCCVLSHSIYVATMSNSSARKSLFMKLANSCAVVASSSSIHSHIMVCSITNITLKLNMYPKWGMAMQEGLHCFCYITSNRNSMGRKLCGKTRETAAVQWLNSCVCAVHLGLVKLFFLIGGAASLKKERRFT